jgi:DNA polymerase III alpha subunit
MEQRQVKTDRYGNVVLSTKECREALLRGHRLDGARLVDADEVARFNRLSEKVLGRMATVKGPETVDMDVEDYHALRAAVWNIPDEYKAIDMREMLLGLCSTPEETTRVTIELAMFEERNLFPLLQFMVFLVDHMRRNKIVWGVGRGSSVASYCLYLLGVHKIDSVRYELPIEEFLK